MTKYAWCYGEISMCVVYRVEYIHWNYNNGYCRTYQSNIKIYKSIHIYIYMVFTI